MRVLERELVADLITHAPEDTSQDAAAPPPLETSPSPVKQPFHLDFLDGMRGLAALYVVVDHARLQSLVLLDVPPPMSPLVNKLTHWTDFGHYAVTFFITLSGFSLMIPVMRTGHLRGGLRGFFIGRARRILPPYYGAMLLSIVIVTWLQRMHTPLYYARIPITIQAVVLHLLLLHNIVNSAQPVINLPMWSIALESQIYLLFPLLVWTWRRYGIGIAMLLAAAVSALLCACMLRFGLLVLNPQFVFIFSLGMLASIRAFEKNATQKDAGCAAYKVSGIVALLACVGLQYLPHSPNLPLQAVFIALVQDLCIGVAGCCLLVVVMLEKRNPIRRIVSLAPIVWVGGFSYSLYLLHFPLQQILWQLTAGTFHLDRLTGYIIVLCGTAPIIAFSFLFYRLLERPFMRSKPRA